MNKLFEIADLRCSYDRNYREGVSKVVLEIRDLILPKGKKIFIITDDNVKRHYGSIVMNSLKRIVRSITLMVEEIL